MRIVVIGGGVAAHEAAVAARAASAEAEIAIFSEEKLRPYRRPMLSGLLVGKTPDERAFFLKPPEFYSDNRIELHLETSVAAIGSGTVELADGAKVPFDRLIVATGGRAVMLPLPVAPDAAVFTLRNYMDLLKLNAFLPECRRAAVIGGGVLGLEIADSLLKRNIEVTVLERGGRLFAGKLAPDDAAALLERLNRIPGLAVRCSVSAAGIGRAGVLDDAGELFAADAVICAAGSRPDVALAAKAGIETNRGVVADERMRTSVPGIFVAGDAAEFSGRPFGLYLDAVATGKVAGTNAAGGDAVYAPAAPTPTRLNALGEKLVMP